MDEPARSEEREISQERAAGDGLELRGSSGDALAQGLAGASVRRFRYGVGVGLGFVLLAAALHSLGMLGVEFEFLAQPYVVEITLGIGGVALLIVSAAGLLERARTSEREVQEESERWRSVMENIPSAVVLLEAEPSRRESALDRMNALRCVALNPPARRLLGANAWDGAPEDIWGEERTAVRSLARALSEGAQVSYTDRYEVQGEIREIEGRVIPLGGKPHRRVLVVEEDVTERRHLEIQYQQAQKMEAVGQLAGGVAHDFNNRLTVIHGSCQMLLDELEAGSPLRESLSEVLGETEQAASLTRQLLAFSRRQVLDRRVLDLGSLVREREPMVRRLIPERIEVGFEGGEEECWVQADRSQIEQVILNLVVNAADAIEGQGRITIGVRRVTLSFQEATNMPWAAEPGPYVELRVEDTGRGMPEKVRQRAFEPFFTTKPEGQGTGLGLSMVYGSVKQSGGHLLIDTEEGAGTTVRALLPEAEERDAPQSHREKTVAPLPAEDRSLSGEEPRAVLVVDDEPSVRKVAARILSRAGYSVLEAGSGREAMDVIGSGPERVDVVVSDLVMPEMSGTELMDRLETLEDPPAVVLISGHSEAELGEAGRRKAARFLDKPFTPEVLVQAVQGVLQKAEPVVERASRGNGPT